MKKVLSIFLAMLLSLSVLAVSAFAYSDTGSCTFAQLGECDSSITVEDQQDFETWYAAYQKSGPASASPALFFNGSVTFDGNYDLSPYIVVFYAGAVITAGSTLTCEAVHAGSSDFTNNGTFIITGANSEPIKMLANWSDFIKSRFVNNGTIIFRSGNMVDVVKSDDTSVVNFTNNGTIYTPDGKLVQASTYKPASLDNGTGSVRQMNTLTASGAAASAEVKGTYTSPAAPATVYNADITWGCMEFTFTDAAKGTWNAAETRYENGTPAAWSCTANANKITVLNRSNTSIGASFAFTAASGYEGITATFSSDSAGANAITDLVLPTAEAYNDGTTPVAAGAREGEAYLQITGGALQSGDTAKTFGTVTVTIGQIL
jgi:hypothetical protein